MTDPFILTVMYKGKSHDFTAQLVQQGYTHRFKVEVVNSTVWFEPDEEGVYRAVAMPGQDEKELAALDRNLLQLLQEKLAAILA